MAFLKNNPSYPVINREISNGTRADGFTLIELIIVMVVVAIVAAVSVPRLGSIFEATAFRRMVNKAIVFLRDSRLDALSTGKKISVVVDLDGGKLVRLIDDGEQEPDSPGRISATLHMPDGVEIWVEQEYNNKLKHENIEFTFYPNGTASGPKLFLKDTGRGKNALIYLEPLAGLIRYEIGVSDKQG